MVSLRASAHRTAHLRTSVRVRSLADNSRIDDDDDDGGGGGCVGGV